MLEDVGVVQILLASRDPSNQHGFILKNVTWSETPNWGVLDLACRFKISRFQKIQYDDTWWKLPKLTHEQKRNKSASLSDGCMQPMGNFRRSKVLPELSAWRLCVESWGRGPVRPHRKFLRPFKIGGKWASLKHCRWPQVKNLDMIFVKTSCLRFVFVAFCCFRFYDQIISVDLQGFLALIPGEKVKFITHLQFSFFRWILGKPGCWKSPQVLPVISLESWAETTTTLVTWEACGW